ncbi:hypothetical protein GPEL0_01f2669 [Geoanaerobacter pelophilus]|uniref:Uncharacterized protein n=1 Tax=Geoanaerobacter pelophilus TaxID=60036 RepID=A0ABQ0MIZ4_9BACT|nr:hypothetical protein GPEL0_01f2669 [Geoanaerobacter pelophilus]
MPEEILLRLGVCLLHRTVPAEGESAPAAQCRKWLPKRQHPQGPNYCNRN